MSARHIVWPLVEAAPWLFVAWGIMWGPPVGKETIAGAFALVGLIIAIKVDSARRQGETQYLVALRHAADECTREARTREAAEALAILAAAKRVLRLADEVKP